VQLLYDILYKKHKQDKKMKKLGQEGSHIIAVVMALVVVAAIGLVGYKVFNKSDKQSDNSTSSSQNSAESDSSDEASNVTWSLIGTSWKASATPPSCPNPVLKMPVQLSKITNVLYPGQTRGTDYKPHGGFLFTGSKNSDISVTLAMDAYTYRASRYIEAGEVQYMFDFIAPCGVMLRYDHLLTLSPDFQKIADTLPAAKADDSRTTNIDAKSIKAGTTIATAVGHTKPSTNTSVDFGVYDLRSQNEVSKNSSYASKHSDEVETAYFGVCWLDWFDSATSSKLKSLPGPGTEGKTSDYCK
jgi:hypothetical protein